MTRKMNIAFFIVLFFIMLGTTIWASLQQNLFTEFSLSGSPMWFIATLVDFYINQIILWFGVVYLEKKNLIRFNWFVLFMITSGKQSTNQRKSSRDVRIGFQQLRKSKTVFLLYPFFDASLYLFEIRVVLRVR